MGDISGRRREEALLVIRAAQWHLRRARVGFVTSFWDVTKAFGSTTHDALNETVDRLRMGHDAHCVKSRYTDSLVALTIPGQPEMLCVAPSQGYRQGDGPAAQRFALTYDKRVEDMMQQSRTLLDETHL
eukprot:14353935-Heterocapsa_arctica.AAC.1